MPASPQSVWLITGAAGALGQELVRQVLAGGADCVALDRNRRGLEQLHDRLLAEGLRAPALYPMDLVGAGWDDYCKLAETVTEHFGRLDVLLHAAGELKALRPIEHQPAEEWFSALQGGLTGPFLLTQALLPLLRADPGGRSHGQIVWINNLQCLDQPAHWAAYGVVQAGRHQMVAGLSAELGPRGPRALEIDPGPFFSALRSTAWPAQTQAELPSAAEAAGRILQQIQPGVQS